MKIWKTRIPKIEHLEAALNEESAAGWEVYSVSQPIMMVQPLSDGSKLPFVLVTFYKVA